MLYLILSLLIGILSSMVLTVFHSVIFNDLDLSFTKWSVVGFLIGVIFMNVIPFVKIGEGVSDVTIRRIEYSGIPKKCFMHGEENFVTGTSITFDYSNDEKACESIINTVLNKKVVIKYDVYMTNGIFRISDKKIGLIQCGGK